MKAWNLPRACMLLFVLAFGLGLSLHGLQAGEMTAAMMTHADGEMPLPGGCDGCGAGGDDGGMVAGACSALCSGTMAVLPSLKADILSLPEIPPAARASEAVGRRCPPDPYPPRPAILT